MKQLLFSTCFSGTMLLSVLSYGQHQYTYRPKTAGAVKAQRSSASATARTSAPGLRSLSSSLVTDPPVINDPIDIYSSENPMDIELLNATVYVHFAEDAVQGNTLLSDIDYELTCSPDYFYHDAQHILVSSISTKNTDAAGIEKVPLYNKSFNHWSVTYNDFVIKYSDDSHSHHDYDYWKGFQSGKIEVKLAGNKTFQINKLILVLKFSKGTKTIVWDTPQKLTSATNQFAAFSYADFKFNQDFEPMN